MQPLAIKELTGQLNGLIDNLGNQEALAGKATAEQHI